MKEKCTSLQPTAQCNKSKCFTLSITVVSHFFLWEEDIVRSRSDACQRKSLLSGPLCKIAVFEIAAFRDSALACICFLGMFCKCIANSHCRPPSYKRYLASTKKQQLQFAMQQIELEATANHTRSTSMPDSALPRPLPRASGYSSLQACHNLKVQPHWNQRWS